MTAFPLFDCVTIKGAIPPDGPKIGRNPDPHLVLTGKVTLPVEAIERPVVPPPGVANERTPAEKEAKVVETVTVSLAALVDVPAVDDPAITRVFETGVALPLSPLNFTGTAAVILAVNVFVEGDPTILIPTVSPKKLTFPAVSGETEPPEFPVKV